MSRDRREMQFRPSPRGTWNYRPKPKKKKTAGGVLFGVAVVFLSMSFLIILLAGISSYRNNLIPYSYHVEENALLRDYTYKNYARLATDARADAERTRDFTETELKLHAVANYYEAATFVRAFEAAGNEERASFYRNQMKELPDQMGEYADCVEEIDKIVFGE